ncbi:hypothetical protein O181_046022 [Austropuccinia psidii MF-1]|uniref:Uncharacterized protein n=1 Tax=Austropuccinia psidii MF-1 TaxID=1389203 RepID=A0A9Q3HJA5_9BASI|nr:hypothetical protein [Austropuccinia psidii MF-1]
MAAPQSLTIYFEEILDIMQKMNSNAKNQKEEEYIQLPKIAIITLEERHGQSTIRHQAHLWLIKKHIPYPKFQTINLHLTIDMKSGRESELPLKILALL